MSSLDPPSSTWITTKPADSPTFVQLHPLVLLTISDYITRHTSRRQQGPVVGTIIGQQNGRSFTLEHAYESKLADASDGSNMILDADFFANRLEQYKGVHKVPPLDVVGLFVLGPTTGPTDAHAALVRQVQSLTSNDNLMLLVFHPELVHSLQGGKLPITLYEMVMEQEGGDSQLKFRDLSFEVETGDAEMIGVDFVAKGGGNATAVPKAVASSQSGGGSAGSSTKDKVSKGKGKAKDTYSEPAVSSVLSPEDDELVASLIAKSNAIKMLNQRIYLIRSYLTTLSPSHLTDAMSDSAPPGNTNHTLLRSINAMLSRLPLLVPPTSSLPSIKAVSDAVPAPPGLELPSISERERQDVQLTSLLASLTHAVSQAQSMGSKLAVVQRDKQTNKDRTPFHKSDRMAINDQGLLAGDIGGL